MKKNGLIAVRVQCSRHPILQGSHLCCLHLFRVLSRGLLPVLLLALGTVCEASGQKTFLGLPHTRVFEWENRSEFYLQGRGVGFLTDVFRTCPDIEYTGINPWTTNANLNNSNIGLHTSITLVSLRWIPRVNLIEYDDVASFSLSIPVQLGPGVQYRSNYNAEYVIHALIPALLQLNVFRGSTKTVLDDYGLTVGFGYLNVIQLRQFADANADFDPQLLVHGYPILQLISRGPGSSRKYGLETVEYRVGLNPRRITDNMGNSKLTNFFFSLMFVLDI